MMAGRFRWIPELLFLLALAGGVTLTAVGIDRAEPRATSASENLDTLGLLFALSVVLTFGFRLRLPATATLIVVCTLAWASRLGAGAAVLLLGVAAISVGRAVLLRFGRAAALECLLVGLTLYGTLIGFLVHLSVNYSSVYIGLLLLPVLGNRRVVIAQSRVLFRRLGQRTRDSFAQRFLGSASIALLGLHLMVALMPERGHDALVTHLLLPERIAWDHVWDFDVQLYVWAVMPMIGDWLYTIGHVIAGESGARLVNFGCIVTCGWLIHDLVRTVGGGSRVGASLAVLVYLSTPLTYLETSSLFIESVWTSLVLGGVAAVLRVAATPAGHPVARRQLILGGLLLGGALAAKAVTFMVLAPLALVLAWRWRHYLRADRITTVAVALLGFFTVGAVPYVRAYVLTGNPVFPFFNDVFESPDYPLEAREPPDQFDLGMAWDFPYAIVFESRRFLEAHPGAPGLQWLLLFLPVAVLVVARPRRMPVLMLAVATLAAWLTCRQTAYLRYLFPSFALVAALIGMAAGGGLVTRGYVRRIVTFVALVVVGLNVYRLDSAGFNGTISRRVIASERERDRFLAERCPTRTAVDIVNQLNEPRHPVPFFGRPFASGLHADVLFSNWYDLRWKQASIGAKSVDELGEAFARYRVRHVVMTEAMVEPHFRGWVYELAEPGSRVWAGVPGKVSVLRIRDDVVFRDQLLTSPDFDRIEGWQATPNVLEVGSARVDGKGWVEQRVPVDPGADYLVRAVVRAAPSFESATVRVRLEWFHEKGHRMPGGEIWAVAVPEAELQRIEVEAPAEARAARVRVAGFGSGAVICEHLSLWR